MVQNKSASEILKEAENESDRKEPDVVEQQPPVYVDDNYFEQEESVPETDININQNDGSAEFIDALPTAKNIKKDKKGKKKGKVESKPIKTVNPLKTVGGVEPGNLDDLSESHAVVDDPEDTEEKTTWIELPKYNWLKVNQDHLAGKCALDRFLTNNDGSMAKMVRQSCENFDYLISLGYEFYDTAFSTKGHYMYMFFRLPDNIPAKIEVKVADLK